MEKWKEICKRIAKLEDWEFVEVHPEMVNLASSSNSSMDKEEFYECYFLEDATLRPSAVVGFGTDGITLERTQSPSFWRYFGSPEVLARSYFEDGKIGAVKAKSESELKMMLAIEGKE